MKAGSLLVAAIMLCGVRASAAELPAAGSDYPRELTTEYVTRLGVVRGHVEVFVIMKEMCNEEFPELAPANDAAYQRWRFEHRALLEEIEQRWQDATRRRAGGDAAKEAQINSAFDARRQPVKSAMVAKSKEGGPAAFRAMCEKEYAQLLQSGRIDIERNNAEHLRVIRAGYGDHYVHAEPPRAPDAPVVDGFKAGEFPPAGAPAVVKLLDAGAEPRREQQCRYQAGTVQQYRMTMRMSMGIEMDGRRGPAARMPGMQFVMAVKIIEANEDEARYEFSLADRIRLIETEGIDPKLLEKLQGGFGRIPPFRGRATITSRCRQKDLRMDAVDESDPATKQMAQSFRESFERISMTMPGEPVGAGARWKVLERFEKDGMTLLQVATAKIEKVDGPDMFVQVEVEQFAAGDNIKLPNVPPELNMQLVRMKTTGRGTAVVKSGSMLPVANLIFAADIVANARTEQLVSQMLMNMHAHIEMAPAE